MVGAPASSVNEMGKALTPDGVIMSDGSLSHTDLMDMPVRLLNGVHIYADCVFIDERYFRKLRESVMLEWQNVSVKLVDVC